MRNVLRARYKSRLLYDSRNMLVITSSALLMVIAYRTITRPASPIPLSVVADKEKWLTVFER